MHIEAFRNFCLSLPHTEETLPFDEDTLVFKVGGKMFALCSIGDFQSINLKCDPEQATALRAQYQSVKPGYHMNKKHWNTVIVNHDMPDTEIYTWVQHSYDLVYASLPQKIKNTLV